MGPVDLLLANTDQVFKETLAVTSGANKINKYIKLSIYVLNIYGQVMKFDIQLKIHIIKSYQI